MGTKSSGDLFITQNAKVKYDHYLPRLADPRFPDAAQIQQELENRSDERSQATQLLQKTQENLEAQEELQNKRKEFRARMQMIKEREKELQLRRDEFNEQVAKFTKFMSDNEEKRNRANKRVTEESKNRESLENDIKAKAAQLEQLKIQREQARQTLAANALYQKYLESVTEGSEDFGDINEILSRYATLADANQDLRNTAEEHSKDVDDLRAELANLIKTKQNEVLVLNSAIVEKKQHLESKKVQVSRREQDMASGFLSQQQRTRTTGEIDMAIANLYSRISLHHHHIPNMTAIEQLEAVKECLQDTQDIIAGNVAQSNKLTKDLKSTTFSSLSVSNPKRV